MEQVLSSGGFDEPIDTSTSRRTVGTEEPTAECRHEGFPADKQTSPRCVLHERWQSGTKDLPKAQQTFDCPLPMLLLLFGGVFHGASGVAGDAARSSIV